MVHYVLKDLELYKSLMANQGFIILLQVLHQDIMSRQHVLDNLSEKAQSLSQSSPVAKVNKFVDEASKKYAKLCNQSKHMLEKFEVAVKDHQQYQDAYQDCADWLNSSRDKVEACADTSGDRVSIQNKLERLRVSLTHVEYIFFCSCCLQHWSYWIKSGHG